MTMKNSKVVNVDEQALGEVINFLIVLEQLRREPFWLKIQLQVIEAGLNLD